MADDTTIHRFSLDEQKLSVLCECMEHYGVGDPQAEWPNNVISRTAVVYANGAIARRGAPMRFAVEREELSLCDRLATEAALLMNGTSVGMGSCADTAFRGFFVAASAGDAVPPSIDADYVRLLFGGTIFPLATITVEPLVESGVWWSEVETDGAEGGDAYFRPWRAMMAWFRRHRAFVDSAFVRIGDRRALWDVETRPADLPPGTRMTGCVLPRLALGLTRRGSLVGLFGFTVQT